MFSTTNIIASAGVPIDVGYTGTLEVGTASDKAGTRYGFLANGNNNWAQQGTGTATTVQYGNLDDVTVTLNGTDYQITAMSMSGVSFQVTILHPDQSDATILPRNLFTTVSIDNKAFNQYNANAHTTGTSWNDNYKLTTWTWIVANPFGNAGDEHTIKFAR